MGVYGKMKKILSFILIFALLFSACGQKAEYVDGMFSDVRDFDAYRDAVKLCYEKGYFTPEGDVFGAYDYVTLSECASIAVRLGGFKGGNDIECAIENGIAYEDYPDWDDAATRADAAYMISHATALNEKNTVADGALPDVSESFAKDEIYHLYRAGIFAGDKERNSFRPDEGIYRAEMAIVIERVLDETKRASFTAARSEARIIAFGDMIGHMPVVNSGKTEDGYNFDRFFENVKKYIDEADIACVNQETIFIENSFTGYPTFGTPSAFGEAELRAGFDVVTQATNHAYDKGENGIIYTTDFWRGKDAVLLGVHESEEDAEKIDIIERNGIKLALLNYTYGLNGFVLPSGKDYLVDLLDDEEKIRERIRLAKSLSDGVIAFLHYGTEYQYEPSEYQEKWAQVFADEGVLAIVSSHPHVVEPLRIVEGKDGNLVPVYYSLGNFISSQNDIQCALCAMADFKVVKDPSGIHVEAAKIVPVITHMENNYYSAYLLDDYPDEMEKRHRYNQTHAGVFSKEYMRELFDRITKEAPNE